MVNMPHDDPREDAAAPATPDQSGGGAASPAGWRRACCGRDAARGGHRRVARRGRRSQGRLLRAHAEVDNIRKRAEREKEETAKYAITRLCPRYRQRRRQLPARHRRRAPGRSRAGLRPEKLPRRRDADRARAAQCAGAPRHPASIAPLNGRRSIRTMHQAVMEMQRTDVPAGTVVQVFQAGFMIEDRVLRPPWWPSPRVAPKRRRRRRGHLDPPRPTKTRRRADRRFCATLSAGLVRTRPTTCLANLCARAHCPGCPWEER